MSAAQGGLVGLLLAAGRGRRYDASGAINKLLVSATQGEHPGQPLAVAAARALRAGVPRVVAVVRPPADDATRDLAQRLEREGCVLAFNATADDGMGGSLACGVRHCAEASGWIVALADMPAIRSQTIMRVAAAIARGALTAAPYHENQRGHPVGFAATLRDELLALSGDVGARELLRSHPPERIDVDDPGIFYDIDRP